ncbi:MAG: hypothetical protein HYX48_06540 [Chlamydiales bacterium]|nr:hypothetical protein [Chlamydiales bacterium]
MSTTPTRPLQLQFLTPLSSLQIIDDQNFPPDSSKQDAPTFFVDRRTLFKAKKEETKSQEEPDAAPRQLMAKALFPDEKPLVQRAFSRVISRTPVQNASSPTYSPFSSRSTSPLFSPQSSSESTPSRGSSPEREGAASPSSFALSLESSPIGREKTSLTDVENRGIVDRVLAQKYEAAIDYIEKLPRLAQRVYAHSAALLHIHNALKTSSAAVIEVATKSVSAEDLLNWPLLLSDHYAKNMNWDKAFKALKSARLHAPASAQWKVDLQHAALLTLKGAPFSEISPLLSKITQSRDVPINQQAVCIAGTSALYELHGRTDQAKQHLRGFVPQVKTARSIRQQLWVVKKQLILFLACEGLNEEALKTVALCQKDHMNEGAYWALLSQLLQGERPNENLQLCQILKLVESPENFLSKSGELLCEYARYLMNPTKTRPAADSPYFIPYDLALAEKVLRRAISLTPQYGDSYIELLRLLKIRRKEELAKSAAQDTTLFSNDIAEIRFNLQIEELRKQFIRKQPRYGLLYSQCIGSSFCSKDEIWNAASVAIDAHMKFLKAASTDEACTFDAQSSAFGIRLNNLGQQIKNGKFSIVTLKQMTFLNSQVSLYPDPIL